jgi:4-diphosphocytidyl-2-C-methyl-D-erythritol kinase
MTNSGQWAGAAAPAKINLYLHVLGRRLDGYHELDSLVAFADIHDRVTVRPAAALELTLDGPFAPVLAAEPAADNLVTRAARALADALGRTPDVAITLTKVLPVASGIGGGSADAAATLRAPMRLWDVPADDPLGMAVAARLGADVPVCLAGRAAYFGGIGDRLDPAPALPECHAVLVNPGVPLPTPAVFKARTGGFSQPGRWTEAPADARDLARRLAERRNDLAPPARRMAPVIDTVLAALEATPDCLLARLSGSGATCFGLYATAAEARAAAERLDRPGWWVRQTRILGYTAALDQALSIG